MTSFNYEVKYMAEPSHLTLVQYRYLFWMMNLSVSPNVPTWDGWNSLITPGPLGKQRIGYMENINLPPISLDVVVQTLKQSRRVAKECQQQYVIVTHDLAMAKLAMHVQYTEVPL